MEIKYEGPCYCNNMRYAAKAINDKYDEAMASIGISAAQYYQLKTLNTLGVANAGAWAKLLGIDRSTMVRNIKPLLESSLIEEAEGSGKCFKLSECGEKKFFEARKLWELEQRKIESFLGKEDAEALIRIGRKLQSL